MSESADLHWTRCEHILPPNGVVVQTKLDEDDGVYIERLAKRHETFWFMTSGAVYMFYTPTHWRPL